MSRSIAIPCLWPRAHCDETVRRSSTFLPCLNTDEAPKSWYGSATRGSRDGQRGRRPRAGLRSFFDRLLRVDSQRDRRPPAATMDEFGVNDWPQTIEKFLRGPRCLSHGQRPIDELMRQWVDGVLSHDSAAGNK